MTTKTFFFEATAGPDPGGAKASLAPFLAAFDESDYFTRTEHPNQVDLDTLTIGTASGVEYGYAIWRFNDSLQSTCPYFFRVSIRSTGTNTRIVLVGQGCQVVTESGGISNPYTNTWGYFMTDTNNSNNTSGTSIMCVKESGFWSHIPYSISGRFFSVERRCDEAGNYDNTGVVMLQRFSNTTNLLVSPNEAPSWIQPRTNVLLPQTANGIDAGDAFLYPNYLWEGAKFLPPQKNFMVGLRTVWTEGILYDVPDPYGDIHTYRCLYGRCDNMGSGLEPAAGSCVLAIWE
jgi:hypothetical protein